MADPRWPDPTVDPNERTPGTCYLGDPQVVNNSPIDIWSDWLHPHGFSTP